MIQYLSSPQLARTWCQMQRNNALSIGYVPTMGALHEGHLSLVRQSIRENDKTCASIFVNPLQFNNPYDLKQYPCDLKNDINLLDKAGCHMVYGGTLSNFFPEGIDRPLPKKSIPSTTLNVLEGQCRPGHLEGVWMIVERLFQTVGNCTAYFGEKDYQQTLLIKELINIINKEDENKNIKMALCPTLRETSGLALSSRNRKLTEAQREVAQLIYQSLYKARQAWQSGERSINELESLMRHHMNHPDLLIEYAVIRDGNNLSAIPSDNDVRHARALIAAYLGNIRLIDNLALDTPDQSSDGHSTRDR